MNAVLIAPPRGGAFAALPPASWAASVAAHALFFGMLTFAEVGVLPPLPEPPPLQVKLVSTKRPQASASAPRPPAPAIQPEKVPAPPEPLPRTEPVQPQPPVLTATAPEAKVAPPPPTPAASALPAPRPAPIASIMEAQAPATRPTIVATPATSPSSQGRAPSSPVETTTANAPATGPDPALLTANSAAEATRLRWHDALAVQLRQMKRYPFTARRLGQEGVVVLGLRVDSGGQMEGLEIRKDSGHALLDRDALQLVKEAALIVAGRLAPGRAQRLEIPIVYRLRGDE